MSYLGMDAKTGLRITDRNHLVQSVQRILTTQLGTRLRRRTFGSNGPALVDAPLNAMTIVQLYAAAATAITAWEPRIVVRRVAAQPSTSALGTVTFAVDADEIFDNGDSRPVSLQLNF